MTITELLKIQNTHEFEEFGNIDLIAVTKNKSSLEFQSLIYTGIENESPQLWQITCHKVKEHKVTVGQQEEDFELFNDHVLLWSYQQPVSSLTFNRANSDTNTCCVIGKLYEKHTKLVGSWIPFNNCFNQHKYLNLENLNFGHGKLAEGAEKLIIGYQEVLQECGFKSSYLSRPPMQWDNQLGWIAEDSNLKVLIIGKSYVIASNFTANKLAD